MVWIIDNGGAYSDHEIYFVEPRAKTAREEEAVLRAFLALPRRPGSDENIRVIAYALEVDWREPEARIGVAEFCYYAANCFFLDGDIEEHKVLCRAFCVAWKAAGFSESAIPWSIAKCATKPDSVT